MPQNILGYEVNVLPKDPTVPSTYVSDIIAAGTTTTIEFPTQYRAVAICTFSVNGQPAVALSAGADQNINDQNIIRVQVVAGAAGAVHLLSQVTPMFYNTEAQRFRMVSQ